VDVNIQAATSAWLGTQPAQAELNLLKAQFAGVNLDNTIKALDVKHQQALEGLMQKRLQGAQSASKNDPNAPNPLQDVLYGEIDDMAKAGMPVEAMDLAAKFAGVQAKAAYVGRTEASTKQQQLATAIQSSRYMYEVAAPASQTMQGWNDFKMQYQASTGQPLPPELAQAAWTPKLSQQLAQQGMSAYQAATLADKKVRTDAYVATQAEQRRKLKFEQSFEDIAKKAQANEEGRQKGKLSSGGAVTKLADAKDLAARLSDDFGMDDTTALAMSYGILDDVSEAMKKAGPGLTREKAMKDALDKRMKAGQIGGDSVNAKGATPTKAIKADANTDFEFNKWYNVDGKKYFYDQSTGQLQPEENILGTGDEREEPDEGAASSVEPPPED